MMFCKLQLFENHQLVTDVNFCKAMILIKFSDHRGLEVCCSGAGSSVSLDLHSGGASWHSGNYFPGMIKQLHWKPPTQTVLCSFLRILKRNTHKQFWQGLLGISSKQHFVTRLALLREIETQFVFIISFGSKKRIQNF